MRKTLVLICAQAALFCAPEVLACDEPATIIVPDGSSASEEDMRAAGEAYSDYMSDMQLYQSCLETEADQERMGTDAQPKSDIDSRENEYAALHNAASLTMSQVTEAFQRAVDAYEARQ